MLLFTSVCCKFRKSGCVLTHGVSAKSIWHRCQSNSGSSCIRDHALWSKTSNPFRKNNFDSISKEFCQPPLSHTYSGVPSASWGGLSTPPSFPFSFSSFHFCINPTLECFNLHNRPSAVRGRRTTFKANTETLSSPFPIHPHPDSSMNLAKPKEFFFLLLYLKWWGVYFNARVFLLTWTQSKEGSLGLSTSLACNSWTSWCQHRRGVRNGERGELCSDRLPIHTADASSWQMW